jgi:DNA-binding transcriptional LysR family regulator
VLQERAPGVVLHTEAPRVATQTYRRLAGGELDFAIGHFEEPPTGLHRKRLATDRIVYIARKGHPRIRQALSRAERRRERLLVQELVTAGQLPSNARDVHQSRDRIHGVIATTPHPLASLFVVSQSDVITGTVERLAEAYRDVLGLCVLPAPEALPPVETHIVWHDRTNRSPAHRWLLGLIEDAAQGSTRPLPSRRRRNRGAA